MPSCHAYNIPGSDQTKNGTLTLMQLVTGATRRLWVSEFSISGKSVNAADVSVRVEWVRQTGAGTGAATIGASTIGNIFEGQPAMIATALEGFTVEPTGGTEIVAGPWYISPVAGLYTLQIPLGDELMMAVSSRLGLRMVTPQSTTMRCNVRCRE